jgi:hypothetical protein
MIWCGFAIFWLWGASHSGAPAFFSLFGVPFVAVGLYFVFGRFWTDAKNRANTIYGITDNRIIIRSGIFSRSVKSLNIKTLSDITINERSDGSGIITLGPSYPYHSIFQGTNWPGVKQAPALDMIPNVREVYNIILRVQSGS